MKRFALLLLPLLVCVISGERAVGQVASFPYNYGWTGAANLGGDGHWSQSIVAGVSGWVFSTVGGYTDSTCVTFNPGNDKVASARVVLRLNTQGMSFSSGEVLRFCLRRSNNQVDAKVFVEWSLDDITYTPIDSILYSVAAGQGTFVANETALPSAIGNRSLVYLGIRLSGNKATQQGFAAGFLDDVAVQGGVLPVQITGLSASSSRLDVKLKWTTVSEVNNHGFEIERRTLESDSPARTWDRVGWVAGRGTASSPTEYVFSNRVKDAGRYAYRIKQIDQDGSMTLYSAIEVEVGTAPKSMVLEPNYPNPFNPSTAIGFTVAESGMTTLQVFDLLGQEVARLFDGQAEAGRMYQVHFDGSHLPSGVYFYALSQGNHRLLKKLTLMK